MNKFLKIFIKFFSFTILNKQKRKAFRKNMEEYFTPIILSRTACLGNFAYDRIDFEKYQVKNHQKNRVDYMLKINEDSTKIANSEIILKYTPNEHKHLLGIYKQEESDIFKYKNVKALIMDSFSELTDQLFVSKNDEDSFCTHYINIDHSNEFNSLYNCKGLIDLDELKDNYLKFFGKVRQVYGNIPIIFINFPTKFDEREKFKNRAEAINAAMQDVERIRGGVDILLLDIVEKNEIDDSPYHFSKRTYYELAKEIIKILNKHKIKVKLKGN